jgi:hypothetical protein
MKINKQLFEDVLAGKLEGTFVLRNGNRISTSNLKRNVNGGANIYPYRTTDYSYSASGRAYVTSLSNYDIVDFIPVTFAIDPEMYSYNQKDIEFIEHFINGYHMKQNELAVEIPDGKEIDWDESKKQNKIILKDKELTYEDICKKLMKDGYCYINSVGWIQPDSYNLGCMNYNTAASEHQLECILAKNKLANVAKYLNDGWKPGRTDLGHFDAYVLFATPDKDFIGYVKIENCSQNSNILFKSKELAQRAVKILGKKTIKLALEPLGF